MDITRFNFLSLLPDIGETIRKCDFIAIDTELSGLMRERRLNRFDLPEERFAKAVEYSRGYFIMQFGLSCYTRSNDGTQYDNCTYNFYIFPQDDCKLGNVNRTFSLQSHAIKFLTDNGFDFNKLFKDGLSYMTFPEKKALNAQLKSEIKMRSKVELNSNGLPKFVPNGMADNCCDWVGKAKAFVAKCQQACNLTETIEDGLNKLEFKDCATSHKRAIFKRVLECQPFFQNIEIDSCYDAEKSESYLVLNYIGKDAKEEKFNNELMRTKGFLEILELVITNRKPIVGHNLALDLIQIINQFVEPLTDDYNAFKELCHSLFPLIYDTKYIAHSILDPDTLTNNQSRLNDLYCQLRDSDTFPKVQVNHSGEIFKDGQIPHQAGYDAYMSGYCFIALCEAFLKDKIRPRSKLAESEQGPLAMNDQIVSHFSNKIHLSYSYDFKCFDLCGMEKEPNREHVFYIEYPQNWTLDDIFQVFYQYGGVSVSKLSGTSAFCALRDIKNLQNVLKNAAKLKDSGSSHKIYSYDEYLEHFKPKRSKVTSGDCDVEFVNS